MWKSAAAKLSPLLLLASCLAAQAAWASSARADDAVAADAGEPAPIPVADLIEQEFADRDRMRELEPQAHADPNFAPQQSQFDSRLASYRQLATKAANALDRELQLSTLQQLERRWYDDKADLEQRAEQITEHTEELDASIAELNQMARRWDESALAAAQSDAPKVLLDRITALRTSLGDLIAALRARRAESLELLAELADLRTIADSVLADALGAEDAAHAPLFARDPTPFWRSLA